ncbi:MAG TPA: CsbD family protein [Rhodanobacteraceae bacterium]|jgi:hypothetical protein|nr:CsbD family protein [Rhodanobacteraceae bacterium]
MTALPPLAPGATTPEPGQDRIKQEWPAISDKLRRRWHKLTSDDVSYAGGSAEYLARVLQDRYGVDRHEAVLQVHEFESEL